jgi:UDP-glucose-4-epimerase GalE
MRILVTGGAGYIGSHTCKALSKKGHEPVVYDNLFRGHEWAVKWGPFIEGDVRDTESVQRVLREQQIEAVVHFAALAYVGESVEKPQLYHDNNVEGSRSLLEAMKKTKVNKLIFSSSCSVHGQPKTLPLNESQPYAPESPYAESKATVEKMIAEHHNGWGLSAVALRYFNACGADSEGELGEVHDPETHLIPLAVDAALGRRENLTIFGTDYPTEDGTCVRDYVHVEDLAHAHILALEQIRKESTFEQYCVGIGQGFSVRQIVDAVEGVSGKEVPVKEGARRAGDPAQLYADNTKIKQKLNWTPKYTNVEEMVRTVLSFIEKNPQYFS